MLEKDKCLAFIKKFRIKHSINDASDENIITVLHLMNYHGLDLSAATDQSSRGKNDHGIDGWYYEQETNELYIYQSKLSQNKDLVIKGLKDLKRGSEWIETVIVNDEVERIPSDNHMLWGLYRTLPVIKSSVRKVYFVLLSLFDKNEIEDEEEYAILCNSIVKTPLNQFITAKLKGKIIVDAISYCLETSLPKTIKQYELSKFNDATINLRKNAQLHLSYVSLNSLVELYRQRGDILFDKNVRLSLLNYKEAKDRLVNPLESTLDLITSGKLSPNIFPFFHIGVTISASSSNQENSIFSLETPSVINGCQTITIANHYLKQIEKEVDVDKREEKLALFREIQVIAKVVVGVSDEELKEITNANNRQNPIDNWQLFSNESIHNAIEINLKEIGIFYERQKGKFDSIIRYPDIAKFYNNTNGTFIQLQELGQIISLSRRNLQWSAKPSEIFINKKSHDSIFAKDIPNYIYDMIWCHNIFKCIKRGLQNYLSIPIHVENNNTQYIFGKPIIKHNAYYLALIYYYQNPKKWNIRRDYSHSLLKVASPSVTEDMQSFYQKIITKTKEWYLLQSNNFEIEPSAKSMEAFFKNLFIELGLDFQGNIPFTSSSINWKDYK